MTELGLPGRGIGSDSVDAANQCMQLTRVTTLASLTGRLALDWVAFGGIAWRAAGAHGVGCMSETHGTNH